MSQSSIPTDKLVDSCCTPEPRCTRRRPDAVRRDPTYTSCVPFDNIHSSDNSRVSLLDIPNGDVEITGGQFNNVAGNQFRFHVNVNGYNSQVPQGCKPSYTTSCEAALYTEPSQNAENVGQQGLSPDHSMCGTLPLPGNAERGASRPTQQVSEAANDIYFRLLATQRHGVPLWIPEPNEQLSVEYQRNGLVIGDIGIITEQGCFDSLFNISLPPDHPLAINSHDLPQNFSPLEIKPSHILKSSKFKRGAFLSNGSVSVIQGNSSGLAFESSALEGAILTLPDGSRSQDLRNVKKLREYLAIHLEDIYRCAMVDHGREMKNGDLRVVTGFDKTACWGMAAFANSTSQTKPLFRVEFEPRDQGCAGQPRSWRSSGVAEVKAGPDTQEVVALRMGDPSQQDVEYTNQTVFVRTETLTLNPCIWNALVNQSGLGELEPDGDSDTTSNSSCEKDVSKPHGSGNSTMLRTGGHSASSGSSSNFFNSLNSLSMHPSNGINAMLLKLNRSARMAITGDNIWTSLLTDDDNILPSFEILWGRITNSYDVRLENGVVFLEKLETGASSVHAEYATKVQELPRSDYDSIILNDSILNDQPRTEPKIQTVLTTVSTPPIQDNCVIAVMGATGVGKTSFVNLASGANLPVGIGLQSCNNEIQVASPFKLDGRSVTLIDTPGFDDTTQTDTEILHKITGFLATKYEDGQKLAGVIYIHRITDLRFSGISPRNFKFFRQLCEDGSLKNVVVLTNRWREVSEETGKAREQELRNQDRLYKSVLDKGATLLRHEETHESALTVIRHIIEERPVAPQIQREFVFEGKEISETTAGTGIKKEIMKHTRIRRHHQELVQVKKNMEEAGRPKKEETRKEFEVPETQKKLFAVPNPYAQIGWKNPLPINERPRGSSNLPPTFGALPSSIVTPNSILKFEFRDFRSTICNSIVVGPSQRKVFEVRTSQGPSNCMQTTVSMENNQIFGRISWFSHPSVEISGVLEQTQTRDFLRLLADQRSRRMHVFGKAYVWLPSDSGIYLFPENSEERGQPLARMFTCTSETESDPHVDLEIRSEAIQPGLFEPCIMATILLSNPRKID